MHEPIQMRPASNSDEPFLYLLFAEVKATELMPLALPDTQLRALIDMQYRGQKMTYGRAFPNADDHLLCLTDGTPVGRILIHRCPTAWRIVDIAVLEAYRGRGIATEAIEVYQKDCAAREVRLELYVLMGNPAIRLYERLGFHPVSENQTGFEMVWNAADAVAAS